MFAVIKTTIMAKIKGRKYRIQSNTFSVFGAPELLFVGYLIRTDYVGAKSYEFGTKLFTV